jgi:4-hydroxybenzoyl-CoA thioesterase
MTWSRTRPVYLGDDDSSGIIYFPAYFQYMSEGDQLLFADIGMPVTEQLAHGVGLPTVHVECDYLAPARAGDVLRHQVRVAAGPRSSVITEHEFRNGDVVVARGRIVRAYTDMRQMRATALPQSVRDLITTASEPA